MFKRTIFSILLGIFLIPSISLAYISPGNPTGFVNDFAGVIEGDTKTALEYDLENFKEETTHEVAVVTISSLGEDTIENYANLLFREWEVGTKENNNGILFLIAIDDRKMRIEVGYGLEGALTDVESKHILDDVVKPHFIDGDYNTGIYAGTQNIKEAILGEIYTENEYYTDSDYSDYYTTDWVEELMAFGLVLFWGYMIFSIPISWLASLFGRSKSWWAGGVTGLILGIIIYLFSHGLTVIPILTIIGLIFDYFVSKNYKAGKKSWWAGGSGSFWDGWGSGSGSGSSGGGWSSGGGSSFGGFSGGSSGGGGASSGW